MNQANIQWLVINLKPHSFIILLLFSLLLSCSGNRQSVESRKYHDIILSKIDTSNNITVSCEGEYELGASFSMVDKNGDTIIPLEKYHSVYTNTITYFGVFNNSGKLLGIDRNGNVLFEVFYYDNGPDYLREGLFRVMRNGKIGYANNQGEVVIPCQFDCAWPFEGGKAKVSMNCQKIKDYEHSRWESDDWYFIDKSGNRTVGE